jgi:hypothetical protein
MGRLFIARFDDSSSYEAGRLDPLCTLLSLLKWGGGQSTTPHLVQLQHHLHQQDLLHASFFLGLFLDTEDGDDIFLRNVG